MADRAADRESAGGPDRAADRVVEPEAESGTVPRTDHRRIRALPISVVLAIVAVGLGLVATDHWRRGGGTLASAAGVGAVVRLVVPERFVGPLAVRSRPFDVGFFALLAVLLALAAIGF